jgi:hypothetical protein
MSPGLLGFKRLVLGLQAGAPNRATRLAVEFAELFDAELLGLLIDDASLRHLAGIPLAHAFSSLGAGWRRLESAQALDEADHAASRAELLFTEAARRLARRRFEIVRGGAAHALAAIWRSDDLVLIEAPAAPAERAAEPFASVFSAALDSAAAVVLTPARLSRGAGSIVAIAAGADDPSIEAAAAIAAAAGEELVIIEVRPGAGAAMHVERRTGPTGADLPQTTAAPLAYAADAAPQALRGLTERLVVISRPTVANDVALAIALARGVPLLSIDPPRRERGNR